jgi:hypothetical protein
MGAVSMGETRGLLEDPAGAPREATSRSLTDLQSGLHAPRQDVHDHGRLVGPAEVHDT